MTPKPAHRARPGWYQGASLVLHAALFAALLAVPPPTERRAAPIEIEVVEAPPGATEAAPEPSPAAPRPAPRPAAVAAHPAHRARRAEAAPAVPPAPSAEARAEGGPSDAGPDAPAPGGAAAAGAATATATAAAPGEVAPAAAPPAGAPATAATDAPGGMAVGPGGPMNHGLLSQARARWQDLGHGDSNGTQVLDEAEPFRVGNQIVDERAAPMVGDIPYSATAPTRVRDTVYFPGFGNVRADAACLTADGKLRSVVYGYDREICDPSELDRPDPSKYPMRGCLRQFRLLKPPKTIEAPLELKVRECARRDYSGDYHRPPCVEWREVTFKQRIDYVEDSFSPDDYRRWSPIHNNRKIQRCKESPAVKDDQAGAGASSG